MIVFDVKMYIYKYEISSNFCSKMYQMPANLKFGQTEKSGGLLKSSRREQKSTKFNICSHLQLMQAYTQPLPDNSSLGILDVIDIPTDKNSMLTIKEQKIRIKKHLGLILDHKLQFHEHIEYIKKNIAKRIGAKYKSNNLVPLKYRKMFANSLMLPQFDYLDIIWCQAGEN